MRRHMRSVRAAALLALLFVASAAVAAVAAGAGPREDALAVIDRWVQASNASDVDGITRLYAPVASFMGTGSRTVGD